MKKLLIPLFSLLISFNSYSGSINGKGLECVPTSPIDDKTPRFVWFENDFYIIPVINGYEIEWSNPYHYDENGTEYIQFLGPDDGDHRIAWWTDMVIFRPTLIMDSKNYYFTKHQCQILKSKEPMIYSLNKVIEDAKKTNKI